MSHPTRLRHFDFDEEKFKELIIYVSQQCADDPAFGSVKLNKILFYADCGAYRLLGAPITGATYQKLQAGPAPRELLPARMQLLEERRVRIESRRYFTYEQKRLVVSEDWDANVEAFTLEERAIVDEVIEFFRPMNARAASDFSHQDPGWIAASDREVIPYEASWISSEPIDQETEEAAFSAAQEFLSAKGR